MTWSMSISHKSLTLCSVEVNLKGVKGIKTPRSQNPLQSPLEEWSEDGRSSIASLPHEEENNNNSKHAPLDVRRVGFLVVCSNFLTVTMHGHDFIAFWHVSIFCNQIWLPCLGTWTHLCAIKELWLPLPWPTPGLAFCCHGSPVKALGHAVTRALGG